MEGRLYYFFIILTKLEILIFLAFKRFLKDQLIAVNFLPIYLVTIVKLVDNLRDIHLRRLALDLLCHLDDEFIFCLFWAIKIILANSTMAVEILIKVVWVKSDILVQLFQQSIIIILWHRARLVCAHTTFAVIGHSHCIVGDLSGVTLIA